MKKLALSIAVATLTLAQTPGSGKRNRLPGHFVVRKGWQWFPMNLHQLRRSK